MTAVTATLRSVSLPDGTDVSVSDQPEAWWSAPNGGGYVDPAHIAPDPKNPRKVMTPAAQQELHDSIAARGVRQPLIVTPRHLAPWAKVDKKDEKSFFLAVGGHRRRKEALRAGVGAVPIKINIYPSEMDHRMDMALLNKGQEKLSEIEEGFEIVWLRDLGWKIDKLCEAYGFSLPKLYSRIHLTMLEPGIQKLLDPALPRQSRLGTILGGHLGAVTTPTPEELEENLELLADFVKQEEIPFLSKVDIEELDEDGRRFALQHLLLAAIQKRGLSTEQGYQFILDHKLKLRSAHNAHSKRVERFHPSKRKEILTNLMNTTLGTVVVGWKGDDFSRIFQLVPKEETEQILANVRRAKDLLAVIESHLAPIAAAKKPTNPEVVRLMQRKAASA